MSRVACHWRSAPADSCWRLVFPSPSPSTPSLARSHCQISVGEIVLILLFSALCKKSTSSSLDFTLASPDSASSRLRCPEFVIQLFSSLSMGFVCLNTRLRWMDGIPWYVMFRVNRGRWVYVHRIRVYRSSLGSFGQRFEIFIYDNSPFRSNEVITFSRMCLDGTFIGRSLYISYWTCSRCLASRRQGYGWTRISLQN